MKTKELTTSSLIICLPALLGLLFFAGCDEKKAAQTSTTPKPGKDAGDEGEGDEGKDEGKDEGDDVGETTSGTAEFDLCKDGLSSSSKLGTWSKLVDELCDDGRLDDLRKTSNVFKGDTPKIIDESEVGGTETVMNLYSSAQYNAAVDDYWALVRLQFVDPKKYKENFEFDEDVTVTDVNANSTSSTYDYTNDGGEGGVVRYVAKTTFVTLKKGQAYVAATELQESKETMTALKGLIIVNKLSSSKVEAFTISNQTYSHQDGQGDATKTRAINSLKNEQKRAFSNAKKAKTATELLDE